ncbi:MAG: ABC transporter ATP-binding protein [Clostridiales bacterium]|nr:ABC transporter ATP-binding protein [Clostridiales bacterium]
MYEVKNLSFSYPKSNRDIIANVDFDVEEGEIYGLLGRSGAGKSTTQKILIRLLTGYRGTILFKGTDLKTYNNSFYEEVGVGFEMPVHFSKLTGRENLLYFSKLYKNRADVDDLLSQVGLYEDRNRKVGEYSKGMKVRLNFARALVNNPKLLFLDEVTNGLDPGNAKNIKTMIGKFRDNGGTVFLTTHLMNDVEELCDRVAFLSGGQIVETDTPKNLKMKYGKRTIKVEFKENGELMDKTFPLENLGTNEDFSELIKNKEIETAHTGETRLEEIFIDIVKDKL